MALPLRRPTPMPIRKADDRRSEVRDLLSQSRVRQLQVAIATGKFEIDPDKIADHVVVDLIKEV